MKNGAAIVAISCVFFASVVSAEVLPVDQAKELERIAIQSLTKTIEGASFELQIKLITGEREINAEMSAAFVDDRLRLKQRHRILGPQASSSGIWHEPCYSILKEDVVVYRNAAYEHGTWVEPQSFYPDLYGSKRIFFPQFIGTATCEIWQMPENSPRGFLGQGDHHATLIAEEELDGLKTIRVNYEQKLFAPITVWYCPDRNGLITKMLESALTPSGLHVKEVRVDLKEWGRGVWFPETIKTSTRHDGTTTSQEIAQVTESKLGVPEDDIFGIAGVDLPFGGVVAYNTMNGPVTYSRWTKEGLRPMTDAEVLEVFPPTSAKYSAPAVQVANDLAQTQPSGRFGQILWIVNVLAILGLVGYICMKSYFNRQQK